MVQDGVSTGLLFLGFFSFFFFFLPYMLNVLEALDFVEVETDLPWQSQRSDLPALLSQPRVFQHFSGSSTTSAGPDVSGSVPLNRV